MPFETPKCDCGKSDVQITCPTCNENLCHACDQQIHITNKFKLHKRIPYVGQNLTQRTCEIKGHEEVQLNIFCKTCSKVICATCLMKEHKNHDSVTLQEAGEILKLELKTFMSPIQEKITLLEAEIKIKEEELKIKKENREREIRALEEVKTLMGKSELDLLTFVSMVAKFKQEHPLQSLPNNGLETVANWIKKPLSGWKLLFCLSKDGKSNAIFHAKCDGKGPTVTVARTKEGYIFGGYAHIPWSSLDTDYESRESFLFSLTDGKGRQPQQLFPLKEYSQYAIRCRRNYGPFFGYGYDLDLNLDSSCGSNLGYSYQTPNGTVRETEAARSFLAGIGSWQNEELEVYLV